MDRFEADANGDGDGEGVHRQGHGDAENIDE
jgi:hypothetical protein